MSVSNVFRVVGSSSTIEFDWPISNASIAIARWNGSSYTSTAVAAIYTRTEGGLFVYRIAAMIDGAIAAGEVGRYRLRDGVHPDIYFNLNVLPAATVVPGDLATAANVTAARDSVVTRINQGVSVSGYASGQSPAALVTGFATPANVSAAQTAIIARGDAEWATADVASFLPTNFADLAIEESTGKVTTANPSTATTGSAHTPSDVVAAIKADSVWGALTVDAAAAKTAAQAVNAKLPSDTATKIGLIHAASDVTTPILADIADIPTNPVLSTDARLDNLDRPISEPVIVTGYTLAQSPGEQVSTSSLSTAVAAVQTTVDAIETTVGDIETAVDAIPANPLLTNDARLANLNAPVGSIPTNPLLTNDARIATFSTFDASTDTVTLSAGSRAAVASATAAAVEVEILDDGTNGQVIATIAAKVAESFDSVSDIAVGVISTRVSNDLADDFSALTTAINSRLASSAYTAPPSTSAIATAVNSTLSTAHGAGSWLSADVSALTVTVGGYALGQSPEDLVDLGDVDLGTVNTSLSSIASTLATKASQTSVNAIPTNPLLTNDARLSAYATATNVVDAREIITDAVATRLASASYTAPPSTSAIATAVNSTMTTAHGSGAWTTAVVSNLTVTVGGYATNQGPDDLVDLSGITSSLSSITTAIAALPTATAISDQIGEDIGDEVAEWAGALGVLATAAGVTAAKNAILTEGGSSWTTATGFSTFDASTDSVTVGGYAIGQSPADLVDLGEIESTLATIPTGALLATDPRLDNLDRPISQAVTVAGFVPAEPRTAEIIAAVASEAADLATDIAAVQTAVDAVPTNPLLGDDVRLDDLAATLTAVTDLADDYVAPDNTGIAAAQSAAETVRDSRTLAAAEYATATELTAVASSVSAIQSGITSRMAITLASQFGVPASGSVAYKIVIQSNDASGDPVDLDSDAMPTITGTAATAGDRSANLGTVTKLRTGRYQVIYTVASTADAPESIRFEATGLQSTVSYIGDAVVTISDSVATDYTEADRTRDQAAAVDAAAAKAAAETVRDARTLLAAQYATATQATSLATAVAAVPTNPLLTNDSRIANFSTFNPATTSVTVGGYASGQSPAILVTQTNLNLSQILSSGVTVGTALNTIMDIETGGASSGGGTTVTSTSLNANAQWPDAVTFAVTSDEPPYYYSDQWTLTFDVPIGIPDSERLLFCLKDGDLDTVADAASILEIELDLPSTSRITRINGEEATALQETYGSLTYETYPDPITGTDRKRCVVTIKDDASALIAAGTYSRGLKRVGASSHFVHDSMTVRAPVTKAIV